MALDGADELGPDARDSVAARPSWWWASAAGKWHHLSADRPSKQESERASDLAGELECNFPSN